MNNEKVTTKEALASIRNNQLAQDIYNLLDNYMKSNNYTYTALKRKHIFFIEDVKREAGKVIFSLDKMYVIQPPRSNAHYKICFIWEGIPAERVEEYQIKASMLATASKQLKEYIEAGKNIIEDVRGTISQGIKANGIEQDDIIKMLDLMKMFSDIEPYMQEYLSKYSDEDITQESFFEAIKQAYKKSRELGKPKKKDTYKVENIIFFLDKFNRGIWNSALKKISFRDILKPVSVKSGKKEIITYFVSMESEGETNKKIKSFENETSSKLDLRYIEGGAYEIDQNDNYTLATLTSYDEEVYKALCSLWSAGNRYITIADIYHVMRGSNQYNLPAKTANKILSSLMKMNCIMIFYDNSNTADKWKKWEKLQISCEHLINLKFDVELASRGTVTDLGIEIKEQPILLKIARANKQFTKFPLETNDMSIIENGKVKQLNMTELNINLKNYLLYRINMYKKKEENTHKILYSTIIKEVYDGEIWKQKKTKLKRKIKIFMEIFKSKGIIKSYEMKQGDDYIYFTK